MDTGTGVERGLDNQRRSPPGWWHTALCPALCVMRQPHRERTRPRPRRQFESDTRISGSPGPTGRNHNCDHGRAARSALELHPTVKPVAMVADAIRDCSRRKGIVLDPFAGSGTTLIAAERTGRRGFGIELDPLYCDVILRRLRSVCGLEAVLQATGQ